MKKFFINIGDLFIALVIFLTVFQFPSYSRVLEKSDMFFFMGLEERIEEIEEIVETDKKYIVLNSGEYYNITEEDIETLCRIVEAECSNESYEGKIAVANVVLNRVMSNKFPNTVEEVVFQKSNGTWQFSPLYDGRYWKVEVIDETVKAVEEAVYSGSNNVSDSLFFMARIYVNSSSNVSWFDSLEKVTEIGGHEFFK